MDAKTRGEKIAKAIVLQLEKEYWNDVAKCACTKTAIDMITAQIEEACAEAIRADREERKRADEQL